MLPVVPFDPTTHPGNARFLFLLFSCTITRIRIHVRCWRWLGPFFIRLMAESQETRAATNQPSHHPRNNQGNSFFFFSFIYLSFRYNDYGGKKKRNNSIDTTENFHFIRQINRNTFHKLNIEQINRSKLTNKIIIINSRMCVCVWIFR